LSNVVKMRVGSAPVRLRRPAETAHALSELTPVIPRGGDFPGLAPPVQAEVDLADEYQRGYLEGAAAAEAKLRAELARELTAHTKRIETLLTSMQGQLWHLYERIERDAFRFALAVAGKIIGREVQNGSDIAVHQVQEALRRVVGVDAIKLRVHPSDEQVIREHRPAILATAESVREFLVEGDESIERGSCIVECASGNVDARWSTQLRQVEGALFGRVSGILGEAE